ncbi:hypothetical protein D7Y44_12660 [Stenotrophomonas maltophilia]|uniref:hypothetical protein n=1 Tax=Stenotrophomonas maltophilia TaxID=40324 RepID=UPI0015DF200C|nr:hypothetical protein [Stenotrophomonas maltophilia]MBA0281533.1 hypothetical protein [Stenotrophomonas maltophilia]MBA0344256.1 hypothetical protein [Stenotrophomonas maltophilia]MBA0358282.1 hypothetical protein [Stenotrophomonas maltophilia]MBA0519271.1 hypothetical protein [Stenotrophomonas maltophilia]
MIYSAVVEGLSPVVEEEVSIEISGERLVCFASYLPFRIEVGETYQVELSPMVFSEYVVNDLPGIGSSITRRGVGYSYEIVGDLKDGRITSGEFMFFDEAFLEDFAFLDGRRVSWVVDRLDVLFI